MWLVFPSAPSLVMCVYKVVFGLLVCLTEGDACEIVSLNPDDPLKVRWCFLTPEFCIRCHVPHVMHDSARGSCDGLR